MVIEKSERPVTDVPAHGAHDHRSAHLLTSLPSNATMAYAAHLARAARSMEAAALSMEASSPPSPPSREEPFRTPSLAPSSGGSTPFERSMTTSQHRALLTQPRRGAGGPDDVSHMSTAQLRATLARRRVPMGEDEPRASLEEKLLASLRAYASSPPYADGPSASFPASFATPPAAPRPVASASSTAPAPTSTGKPPSGHRLTSGNKSKPFKRLAVTLGHASTKVGGKVMSTLSPNKASPKQATPSAPAAAPAALPLDLGPSLADVPGRAAAAAPEAATESSLRNRREHLLPWQASSRLRTSLAGVEIESVHPSVDANASLAVYTIRLRRRDLSASWAIHHRYSEFDRLRCALGASLTLPDGLVLLTPFPPKRCSLGFGLCAPAAPFFGPLEPGLLRSRSKALWVWLEEALSAGRAADEVVAASLASFIGLDEVWRAHPDARPDGSLSSPAPRPRAGEEEGCATLECPTWLREAQAGVRAPAEAAAGSGEGDQGAGGERI